MRMAIHFPGRLLLPCLAGWVRRDQRAVIEFLVTQIEVLMAERGRKRLLLTDRQRRRLAVRAGARVL